MSSPRLFLQAEQWVLVPNYIQAFTLSSCLSRSVIISVAAQSSNVRDAFDFKMFNSAALSINITDADGNTVLRMRTCVSRISRHARASDFVSW